MEDQNGFQWECERAHRIIEKFGGVRRDRVFVQIVGGQSVLFETRFDGERVVVLDSEILPARLASMLDRLRLQNDAWLERVAHSHRRHANVVWALELIERLVRGLRNHALACRGTKYLAHSVVNVIIGAAQRVANYPGEIDGVDLDRILGDAALEIHQRLLAAKCA